MLHYPEPTGLRFTYKKYITYAFQIFIHKKTDGHMDTREHTRAHRLIANIPLDTWGVEVDLRLAGHLEVIETVGLRLEGLQLAQISTHPFLWAG